MTDQNPNLTDQLERLISFYGLTTLKISVMAGLNISTVERWRRDAENHSTIPDYELNYLKWYLTTNRAKNVHK